MNTKTLKLLGSLIMFCALLYCWAYAIPIRPAFALWGWALVLVIDLRAFFGV